MIQFIATLPSFPQDHVAQTVWRLVKERFDDDEGVCYYKYPVVKTNVGVMPDLTLLVRKNQPLVVRCLPYQLEQIEVADENEWTIDDVVIESPLLELEDLAVILKAKFDRERQLRKHHIEPLAVLALPLISQRKFEQKFGPVDQILGEVCTIWEHSISGELKSSLESPLSDIDWRLTRAVLQGVTPLNKHSNTIINNVTTLSAAIKKLDEEIALLDKEQEKAALQIAPGPQCIRGLAGTGKTVLLAMRAANIHLHYPDQKILFTFNTQSLYNQAKILISKFYRVHSDTDPDWERLHIRHGWGGRSRPGVYSDLCARQKVPPLDLSGARSIKWNDPFRACCQRALEFPILPEYDFILVDEAQDFPKEFFEILYNLAFIHQDRQIYLAYDELQTLSSLETQKPENRFGVDVKGKPLLSFEGDDYPGDMERDFILHRSYRCPQQVLMLAHAIGLGLYSPGGCVQMLEDKNSWEAIGYEVESGLLQKGHKVVIYRPPDNSPNPIYNIYKGQDLVITEVFTDREAELDWIAESIRRDIEEEGVAPEQIVVICLDTSKSKDHLPGIQKRLFEYNIASTIPGLIEEASAFAESGRVTLSTVFRAKGNEACIVYIASFDSLYDYIEEIGNRNRAFTSITRSKAWVRITGTGKKMEEVKKEIDCILTDIPRFKFDFPDMERIRRLGSETNRKRKKRERLEKIATEISNADLKEIASLNPAILDQMSRLVDEARRENQ